MTTGSRGETKVGKYTLLNRLTMGGMAELFLGYTRGPGGFRKYVVIKRILPDAAANENFVKMFLDEARITAGFSHSNIVQTYDLGEDDEGLYVVMEFVPGQNLNQIVNACADQQAVFPLGFSLSVLYECALALQYAHTYRKPTGEAYPVIHRDVAQKNIMVTYDGQIRLLDFGIAKARGALSRTSVGTVKGTAGYMSPEQVRGEDIDGRSDVFALGVVLWESCTGRRLFAAESETQEMRMILDAPIASPSSLEPSVPEAVSEVVLQALARSRDSRFPTAKDLAKALHTAAEPLLFDVEERANFMRERFAGRIAATQKLFDVSDSVANSVQFQEVVKSFQDKHRPAETSVKVAPGVHLTKQRPKSEADQQLAQLQLQAEMLAGPSVSTNRPRNLTGPLFIGIIALVALAIGWKIFAPSHPTDTESGLSRFPGEPEPDEEANNREPKPIQLNPAIPILPPADPVLVPPPEPPTTVDTSPIALPLPLPTPVPVKVPDKKQPVIVQTPRHVKAGGTGVFTLGLLPDGASVRLGSEMLCRQGLMCKVTLPAGLQKLTITGPDGTRRSLPVQVSANDVKSMRVRVDSLPPQ